jgi:hypothetical protein
LPELPDSIATATIASSDPAATIGTNAGYGLPRS